MEENKENEEVKSVISDAVEGVAPELVKDEFSVFVDEDDTFDICVWVTVDKNVNKINNLVASHNKDALEKVYPGQKYIPFNFTFRMPTHKDDVAISRQAISITAEFGIEIDPALLVDLRLKALLKSWDLKDKEGNPVLMLEENVDKLNPIVSNALKKALEEMLVS